MRKVKIPDIFGESSSLYKYSILEQQIHKILSFYLLSAEVNYGIRFSDWGEAEQFISQLASEVRYDCVVGADQCGMSIPNLIFFPSQIPVLGSQIQQRIRNLWSKTGFRIRISNHGF